MDKGTAVWVSDASDAWVFGEVVDVIHLPDGDCTVSIKVQGREENVQVGFAADGAPQSESDPVLVKANDFGRGGPEGVQDLISLPHLHEAAILHVVSARYATDSIYTNTGSTLLAVNPFRLIPSLYTPETLQSYYSYSLVKSQMGGGNADTLGSLPPHVYATAAAARTGMLTADSSLGQLVNQSLLVSGESGAGKTETTKIVMRFIASVAQSSSSASDDGPAMHERVLQSNPILEAFGNAKTTRNENSSRFGKFIELQHDDAGVLVGARISHYLLEKVRLVHVGAGERTYHAFYQLCAGASDEWRREWALGDGSDASMREFALLSQSGCFALLGESDADGFRGTQGAMGVMGLAQEEGTSVWKTVAALLHLGNTAFTAKEGNDDASSVQLDGSAGASFRRAAGLLGVQAGALEQVLTQKHLVIAGETTVKAFSASAASDARDALLKTVYSRLFDFVVARVNSSIRNDDATDSFIGILDIFGFEHFETNSFEQLCINYANETLQQHFNHYIFKAEQAEYKREGISCDGIHFEDNQVCLTLIEGKSPPGILSLLDEACLMPKATDESFARKLYDNLKPPPARRSGAAAGCAPTKAGNACFAASSKQVASSQFAVQHYAGSVTYSTTGFCDKNRDSIHDEALQAMADSETAFISALFTSSEGGKASAAPQYITRAVQEAAALKAKMAGKAPKAAPSTGKAKRTGRASKSLSSPTVGTQFRSQLKQLLSIINATSPHYIRCLKPNAAGRPQEVDRASLISQLRCGGVLEAVRVSRVGFPVRFLHGEFLSRFSCLAQVAAAAGCAPALGGQAAQQCTAVMHALVQASTGMGEPSTAPLSGPAGVWRSGVRQALLQTTGAAGDSRLHGMFQVGNTKVFFRHGSFEALDAARSSVQAAAASAVQLLARGMLQRSHWRRMRGAALRLQCAVRCSIAKTRVQQLRAVRAGTALQAFFKMVRSRCRFVRGRLAVTLLQAAWRGAGARQQVLLLIRDRAATKLQSTCRMWSVRSAWCRQRAAAVALQCLARRRRAVLRLRHLRQEARNVGNLKGELRALKEALRSTTAENSQLRQAVAGLKQQLAGATQTPAEQAGGVEEDGEKQELASATPALPAKALPPLPPAWKMDVAGVLPVWLEAAGAPADFVAACMHLGETTQVQPSTPKVAEHHASSGVPDTPMQTPTGPVSLASDVASERATPESSAAASRGTPQAVEGGVRSPVHRSSSLPEVAKGGGAALLLQGQHEAANRKLKFKVTQLECMFAKKSADFERLKADLKQAQQDNKIMRLSQQAATASGATPGSPQGPVVSVRSRASARSLLGGRHGSAPVGNRDTPVRPKTERLVISSFSDDEDESSVGSVTELGLNTSIGSVAQGHPLECSRRSSVASFATAGGDEDDADESGMWAISPVHSPVHSSGVAPRDSPEAFGNARADATAGDSTPPGAARAEDLSHLGKIKRSMFGGGGSFSLSSLLGVARRQVGAASTTTLDLRSGASRTVTSPIGGGVSPGTMDKSNMVTPAIANAALSARYMMAASEATPMSPLPVWQPPLPDTVVQVDGVRVKLADLPPARREQHLLQLERRHLARQWAHLKKEVQAKDCALTAVAAAKEQAAADCGRLQQQVRALQDEVRKAHAAASSAQAMAAADSKVSFQAAKRVEQQVLAKRRAERAQRKIDG